MQFQVDHVDTLHRGQGEGLAPDRQRFATAALLLDLMAQIQTRLHEARIQNHRLPVCRLGVGMALQGAEHGAPVEAGDMPQR